MSTLVSPTLTFQHASSAAHTVPIHRGRSQARQTLEVPLRQANRSSSASSTGSNMSSSLRGFYEHEEYERIEKVVVERIESLKKLNNPRYARKLKECEARLEDVREKLARAHEKFARESDDDHTPGSGSGDDEDDASSHLQQDIDVRDRSESRKADSAIFITMPEEDAATNPLTRNSNDSAVSLHDSAGASTNGASPNAVRKDEVPYLSAALLDCHATADTDGVPYLTAQPTLVWEQDKQRWVEIRCNHCGAQSVDGEVIRGMSGMLNHIRLAHHSKSS